MSFAELKAEISRATPEERLELAALLAHLNRVADPSWKAELDVRLMTMQKGKKSDRAALETLDRDLSAQGQ